MIDLLDDEGNLRISGLIAHLQNLQAQHGDLAVSKEGMRGGVHAVKADDVQVSYIKPPEPRDRVLHYVLYGNVPPGSQKVLRIL